jgi:AraC-like DNA-binding protein
MHPIHFNPPEALADYIAFYGFINVDENFHEPYCSPPLGLCGFHFNFEGEFNARLNGELFLKDRFCAGGQITAPMIGSITGRTRSFLVFIQPCGIYQLYGFDMSLLTNTTIPLQEFLGQEEFNDLMDKLNAADGAEAMAGVMNTYFLSHLPVFEIAPKVSDALNYIHESKGNVSVKDIETKCFITARSLERHFKLYIGLSPKDYVKIYRFKCLVNFIHQHPGVSWDSLCQQNGYYDQSHLTRYFTRYLKMKPGEMVNLDMDFINYLLQES